MGQNFTREVFPEGYNLYPMALETDKELNDLKAAYNVLHRHHRKFHCLQSCVVRQLKGNYNFLCNFNIF